MRLFKYAYKDSITGRFVTKRFAKEHPRETMRVRIWFWQKDKRGG